MIGRGKKLEPKPSMQQCQQCNMVQIVGRHIHFLLKLFLNDIGSYKLKHVTKCLTTAVLIMYLYIGQNAIDKLEHCNVPMILDRYKNTKVNQNMSVIRNIKNNMFNLDKERKLYYFVLTDGHMSKGVLRQPVYFPGHVMVIEKFFTCDNKYPFYYLYQSYINEYNLNDWFLRSGGSPIITMSKMRQLMSQFEYLLQSKVWDTACEEFWSALTGLEKAETFIDCEIENKILLCSYVVTIDSCTQVFKDLLLAKKSALLKNNDSKNKIDHINLILSEL